MHHCYFCDVPPSLLLFRGVFLGLFISIVPLSSTLAGARVNIGLEQAQGSGGTTIPGGVQGKVSAKSANGRFLAPLVRPLRVYPDKISQWFSLTALKGHERK